MTRALRRLLTPASRLLDWLGGRLDLRCDLGGDDE